MDTKTILDDYIKESAKASIDNNRERLLEIANDIDRFLMKRIWHVYAIYSIDSDSSNHLRLHVKVSGARIYNRILRPRDFPKPKISYISDDLDFLDSLLYIETVCIVLAYSIKVKNIRNDDSDLKSWELKRMQ